MLLVKERMIITECSGELQIPDYCFGVADDFTKTGWLLVYLLSNYNIKEPRINLLNDAQKVISYCNEYSVKNRTAVIKNILCNKHNKVNFLDIVIEHYGRAPKIQKYNTIVGCFNAYIYYFGTNQIEYNNDIIITPKNNYLALSIKE